MRSCRNQHIESILNEFRELTRLEQADIRSAQHEIDDKPHPDDFAMTLKNIVEVGPTYNLRSIDRSNIEDILSFSLK